MRYDGYPNWSSRRMLRQRPLLAKIPAAIQRYGLAVSSVAVALGVAIFLERHHFTGVEFPLFLLAIAITVWYAGVGAAILGVFLSSVVFDFFFPQPRYSLYVRTSELPYYIIFILFALLLTWFSAVRRRVERDLLQSRDELEREVAIRTQQAGLLNLTHDTIFVRDMSAIITYWNRGAQEMYGWTPEQAIGKRC